MEMEDALEVIRLEDIYKKKFNDRFPMDYYEISNLKVRKKLLEEAINSETELKDLEYIKKFHLSKVEGILENNLNESIKKR